MKALALALLLIATPALAASQYPKDSVGMLLHGYGDDFRQGYLTGFGEAFFATGGQCPISVNSHILLGGLRGHVQSGRIALTDNDQVGIARTLALFGCTHPSGTKNTRQGA